MKRQNDQLKFDADFENGSMDRIVRLGVNWYHLFLRSDTWYFFHFRVRGCRGREIIFEFDQNEATHSAVCPYIGKGVGPTYEQCCEENKPFVSYDGKTWRRVDRMETSRNFPRRYRFTHTFSKNEAYVCYTHPYTYSDMLAWLETVKKNPLVKIESIGKSRNGISQPLLTITENSSSRDLVVLIVREDSDEPLGSWGIEGVVRRLLASESKKLLQRYTFKIVPMVCVDGVIAGATHSAGYGYGGCRWHEEPAPAEIENVKSAIKQWVKQGYRLKLAGKLHGGYRLSATQKDAPVVKDQDTLTSNPAIRDALKRYTDEFWRGIPTDLQIRPKGFFERFMLDEFNFGNIFGTHIQGATPENARRCGEGLMKNINAWLSETDGGK